MIVVFDKSKQISEIKRGKSMFLFKPKQKEELLPPPPPAPSFEAEEAKVKPKFFDELAEPSAKAEFSEETEFGHLIEDLGEESKPKARKKGISLKKLAKKQKIPKKIEIKKAKKMVTAKKKEVKPSFKKIKPKLAKPKREKLDDLDFILPKELKEPEKEELEEFETEDVKLPEKLEGLELEDFGKELGFEKELKEKPEEVLEAEEEIKSAIESIREQERPSFFKRFFAKKERNIDEKPSEHLMPELPEIDELSIIRNNINKAREALMMFDLETAKRGYIEAMKRYNKIKPEEQAKVYQDIKELYFERKSAEELKV